MGRWWVVAATGVVLLLIGGGALWWWSSSQTATSASNTGDGAEAAVALELLETEPASLLPAELVESVGPTLEEAIPAGTKVEADAETWMPSDSGGGVIEVTLTYADGTSALMAAVMVEEPDGWKVLQTIPLEAAP